MCSGLYLYIINSRLYKLVIITIIFTVQFFSTHVCVFVSFAYAETAGQVIPRSFYMLTSFFHWPTFDNTRRRLHLSLKLHLSTRF